MDQHTQTMRAAAINRFGDANELTVANVDVPHIEDDEILIAVATAGVGVWDPMEREGAFAEMLGAEPEFPYILGSDGAGTVVATGAAVGGFRPGQRVYAYRPPQPVNGFYAEYTAVKAEHVAPVPENLTLEEAGAMPADAITALCGLEDVLGLREGESLLIFGASGGIGHIAVQLAKRMGAQVLAVASGSDGVALAHELGADAAIDGHKDDVAAAARDFARDGFDAALITATGDGLEAALDSVRPGGRVAYPNGAGPIPERPGLSVEAYDGVPDRAHLDRLNELIESGPFTVKVARMFSLEQAAEAHRALAHHYLGKLALDMRERD